MTTWNYRVIEFVTPSGIAGQPDDVWRAVHEVFYDKEGNPTSYGENPAAVGWDMPDGDPLALLDRMREAITKPVLSEQNFPNRQLPRRA